MALSAWMTSSRRIVSPERSTADLGGPAAMSYLKAGEGAPLVLLHGLLGTAGAWRPSLPSLAQRSTVYAPDALGIGDSPRVFGLDASLGASAERVLKFLDAVGVERTDLLGTSHGGAVALMVAAKHPERVRSLILHAPANPFCGHAETMVRFYRSRPGRWFARRVPGMPAPLQAIALERMYGDASRVNEGSLEEYVSSLRKPGSVDYVLGVIEHWTADMATLRRSLRAVGATPVLLLWGDRDRAVSLESASALQRHFTDASLTVLPGVGHLPFEEAPALFSAEVNTFLERRRSGRDEQSAA